MMQYCYFSIHVKAKLGIEYYYTTNSIYAIYKVCIFSVLNNQMTHMCQPRNIVCYSCNALDLPVPEDPEPEVISAFLIQDIFTQDWICKQTVVMSK